MQLVCDNHPVIHEIIKYSDMNYHFIIEKNASRYIIISFVNSNELHQGSRYICNKLNTYNLYTPPEKRTLYIIIYFPYCFIILFLLYLSLFLFHYIPICINMAAYIKLFIHSIRTFFLFSTSFILANSTQKNIE